MATQTDPLFGQTITGPDGIKRGFKELSRTITELESGVDSIHALEQQRDPTKSIVELYFAYRGSASEEHKRSECGWLCDGHPHRGTSVCRVCKRIAGPQGQSQPFSIERAHNHIRTQCGLAIKGHKKILYRAFTSVDLAFLENEKQQSVLAKDSGSQSASGTPPTVTSTIVKGKKRAARSETEIDMERDEILERRLAEEDRREYRPSPVSSVDEDELRSRCLPANTVLAATPQPQKTRTKIDDRGERLSQRSTRKGRLPRPNNIPEVFTSQQLANPASIEPQAQAGVSQPISKKRKVEHTTSREDHLKGIEASPVRPIEPIMKSQTDSQNKGKRREERKLHARSAPVEPLPPTPTSEPPEAKIEKGAGTATLADFGQLLKAANLTDLDELKAGLDRKRVPRFVGYLAEAFPEHISSHLTRFNLIEAFESFLEDT